MFRFVLLGCMLTSLALTSHAKGLSQADIATAPALADQTVAPRYSLCNPYTLAAQGLSNWRRDEHGEMIQCIPAHYNSYIEPVYHWANAGLASGMICGIQLAPYERVNCKTVITMGSPTHRQSSINLEFNTSHSFGSSR